MLSESKIRDAYDGAWNATPLAADENHEALHLAGLRAVEAASRADMQPREVRTVEELDALPIGSVVLGPRSRAWQKHAEKPYYHQWMCGDGGFVRHGESAYLLLPAQILFTPSTPNQQGAEQ